MTGTLDGKVALITGGGRGIGRATARAFAREGARIVIGNRDAEAGRATAAGIEREGGEAVFVRTDVTRPDEIEVLVGTAVERFGGLDIAFNNAGVMHPAVPVAELDDDDFRSTMDVNVRGVWLGVRAQIPAMLERGGGTIVNTASVLGLVAVAHNAAYVASKHAVLGLTKAAALEYGARGIRVNAVSPALTDTELAKEGLLNGPTEEARARARADMMAAHPIGRIASPEEVAEAVLWLAGPASSFFLGQSLTLDGGWSAR